MSQPKPFTLPHRIELYSLLCGISLCLISCGDEGSFSPNQPLNQAPFFSSAAAVDFTENGTGVAYVATANDPNGDTLSFSLPAGVGDNERFTIVSSSGAVSFLSAPDFERPTDQDANNVYDIVIRASDGRAGLARQSVSITVTDVVQTPVLRRKVTGLTLPLYLDDLRDGSGRVIVLEKPGRIRVIDPSTGAIDSVDFADLRTSISDSGEGGLLGMAFAPDFETSRQIYVNVTNLNGDTEIRRYDLMTGRDDMIDPATQDIILRITQPFSNHNAGWIRFDQNGFLVIPTGDGGSGGDPNNEAQNPTSLLGKVLRLDVSSDDFPTDPNRNYTIPPGNTFSDPADGRPEIFALGLRNPFRASFDPASGDLLMGDVGQNRIEEVSRLPMDDSSLNFGWRVKEGTQDFTGTTTASLTPPVLEYSHGTGPRQGRSIAGGYVYTGPVEALQNVYIFGDFISGNVWGVPIADLSLGQTVASDDFQVLTPELQPDEGSLSRISSFGLDVQDNLYILTIGGDVFRLEAAP